MRLFDFFRSKRKKKKAGPAAETMDLSGVDPAELVPPETKYTREYQAFLASREEREASGEPGAGEETP